MTLTEAIRAARSQVEAGAPFAQAKSADGHSVEALMTQARLKPARHVRLYVWDATGRRVRAADLPTA